jgi:two-component system nitrogen regulation response regulator GlnG
VLSAGEVLTPEDFSFLVAAPAAASEGGDLVGLVEREVAAALDSNADDVYRRILERVEKPLLEAVLAHTDGNQIRAAAILGINRNTLRKKIVELGIPLPGRH